MAAVAGLQRSGSWDFTDKTIILDTSRGFLDGHHRLSAIVVDLDADEMRSRFLQVVALPTGLGKTEALLNFVMRSLRGFGDGRRAKPHADDEAFAQELRASAEEMCGQPSITTPLGGAGLASGGPHDDPPAEQDEPAAEAWAELVRLARAELVKATHRDIFESADRHPCPASPCGVIRLAASVIPRAPGGRPASAQNVQSIQGPMAA
ncbi:hypothetical protein [Streptomyces sp. NPDC059452]|uniref:hypothetical protein n=1 Tax=Streptomyces sp. NPDC059452 TaxID=3346835 RepID=UPI0036739318